MGSIDPREKDVNPKRGEIPTHRIPIPETALPEKVKVVWQYICTSGFAPGDRLPSESVLKDRLKIGRPQLRESLIFLEYLGLIDRVHKAGTFLKSCAPFEYTKLFVTVVAELMEAAVKGTWREDEVDEVRRARAALEGGIAYEATRYRSAEDLEKMRVSIDEEMILARKSKPGRINDAALLEWIRLDQCFHEAILDASHNSLLKLLGGVTVAHFARKRPPKNVCYGNIADRIIDEHCAILDAIQRGVPKKRSGEPDMRNADLARNLMYAHVINPKEERKTFALPEG